MVIMDNYKWLIANENVVNSIHEKWVIIRDGKILAVGDNLKTLIDEIGNGLNLNLFRCQIFVLTAVLKAYWPDRLEYQRDLSP